MLFHSMEFLTFFPIVVLTYFLLPKPIKQYYLLAASWFFYMCWNPIYIFLLLYTTIITYLSGILLKQSKNKNNSVNHRRLIVAASFILNLIPLFYYKYLNFFLQLIHDMLSSAGIRSTLYSFDILLPVGISFYVFQALSYTMDVYRDEIYAEKSFFRYALFVSFFPQLVAGPIERSKNLLRQLSEPKSFNYDNVRNGLLTILWGYFLKLVIADRAAVIVDTVYNNYSDYTGISLIIANVLFALQIYCDFMGYSIIAKGAAKVLGYELISNFERPYYSTSIKEFWRRWHISLSSWLRDYLYIPLGGSRCGRMRKYINLMITFLVSGLWHGASLNYVMWGAFHGLAQIAEDLFSPVNKWFDSHYDTTTFSWKFLRGVLTFFICDIIWVFFRADTLPAAVYIIVNSFRLSNAGSLLNGIIYQLGLDERNVNILFIAALFLILVSAMQEKGINMINWLKSQNAVFRYLLYWLAVIMIIISLDITGQEFIYFQF